jgi:hypothetical protein
MGAERRTQRPADAEHRPALVPRDELLMFGSRMPRVTWRSRARVLYAAAAKDAEARCSADDFGQLLRRLAVDPEAG